MTFNELKPLILELNPDKVVKCEMDNFSCYPILELPEELQKLHDEMSDEDMEEYELWVNEMIGQILPDEGIKGWK